MQTRHVLEQLIKDPTIGTTLVGLVCSCLNHKTNIKQEAFRVVDAVTLRDSMLRS